MEKIPLMLNEANKIFRNSDHLAYMTYPLIRDNKLLVRIAENLSEALTRFMEVVLYYDRLYKRIGPYPENFRSKFEIFKTKCARRYGFEPRHLKIIQELKEFVEGRKKSSMEFVRDNKYFVAGYDYKMKSLDITQLKKYINESKEFVRKVNSIFPK
ncbi:MAG: hypothetical protein KKG60_02440 [Nanoarchaeota archaeon]|nr:hypothetical protein [Nanoarchaeota archaeon]